MGTYEEFMVILTVALLIVAILNLKNNKVALLLGRMGGWETDHVMKSIYGLSMMDKAEEAKRNVAEKLRETLFG